MGIFPPKKLMAKKQRMKQKEYCNKFNTDFQMGPHQEKKFYLKKKEDTEGSAMSTVAENRRGQTSKGRWGGVGRMRM